MTSRRDRGWPGRVRAVVCTAVSVTMVASARVPASTAPRGPQESIRPSDRAPTVPGGGVPVLPLPADPAQERASLRPTTVTWPGAGSAEVDLAAGPARAGNLPIRVGPVTGEPADAPADGMAHGRVRVDVLDQDAARRLGITGLVLRLQRSDGATTPGRVAVELDYGTFRAAAGGEFGPRLRVVRLPACAFARADCAGAAGTVPAHNDLRTSRVSAELEVSGSETDYAILAGPSGSTGSFSATGLAPSSRWQVGLQSGEFTWNYPIDVPPVPGPEPELEFSYSSGGVDGRMASSNNQPSWVGEGFDFGPGYIERSYKTCNKDTGGSGGNEDWCWVSHNAASVFDGVAGELVRDDATGTWRAQDDSGWRVELLTGAVNGDNDGEYWRLTSPEGTQYYFGLNRLPGWATGRPETQSAWTAPVFGNHAGEPCRTGSAATSWCQQGYRWYLDYVVDRYGDVASYYYQREMNNYGRWNGSPYFGATTPYVRGGYLTRIDYGQRDGAVYTTNPSARVALTVADRCATTGSACDPANSSNWKNWPDVPWDQRCTTSCTYYWTPTFWTTKRLSTVTTQVWSGTAMRDVGSWTLRHSYPDPYPGGDPIEDNNDASRSLWLNGIVHTGHVGGTASLPEVTFEGVSLQNRHNPSAAFPALYKWRIRAVNTETGGRIEASYSSSQCGGEPYVIPDQNVSRCYARGDLPAPRLDPDVFYKYVVNSVREADRVAGATALLHQYEYVGGAAWHYDDSDATPNADRDWNQWRGYQKVRVRSGDPAAGPQTLTEHLFLRGMDGDVVSGGRRDVWVSDSQGGAIEDSPRLRGFAREIIVYNGSGSGVVVTGTLNDPWVAGPVASRSRTGLDPVQAFQVDIGRTRERAPLADGGVRVTEERRAFDGTARLVQVDDLADTATASDDSCTRLSYATGPNPALPARVEQVGVGCAVTPRYPEDIISDERLYYDGAGSFGIASAAGNLTREEDLVAWESGAPVYATGSRVAYDAHGREVEEYDALGNRIATAYTPTLGGPVNEVRETNALGHTDTTTVEPAWGEPVTIVDANGRRTDLAYDPLGRLTAVWLPGRSRSAGQTSNLAFEYLIRTNGPAVVTTRRLQGDGSYTTSLELYDGLLRDRQTQVAAPGGGRVVTDTFYDSHGWATKTNAPYANTSPPSTALVSVVDSAVPHQTVNVYDAAGRETTEIVRGYGIEKWRTTTGYGGNWVSRDPPDGAPASMLRFDGEGQLTEVRQFRTGTPSGAYDTTRYTYTKAGALSTVTDAAGNVWRYTYDLRGRVVRTDDPDKGTSTVFYDEGDRVTSTTDGRGRTLSYTYDALDRKTAVFDGATKLAAWTYDTVGKGLTTSSTRFVGGNAYTTEILGYDADERPTGTAVTIPAVEGALAGRYETGFGYDGPGQLTQSVLPAAGGLPAETIQHGYNGFGLPTTMTGLSPYVTASQYTALAEPTQYTFGAAGKQVWQTFTYDATTRRLARMQTDRSSGAVSDLNFSYDDAGNLVSLADTPAGGAADVQCFRHDHQRRLVEAWTATDNCAATPSQPVIGGPAPYWHTYGYDVVGNRTSEVRHAAGGDTTRAYTYPTPGTAQPHAVRSVAQSGAAGTRTDTYAYDLDGNTTTRPGQVLVWGAEGMLASVAEGGKTTSYVYDAAGERLLRRDPTGTTLYLGATELRLDKTTGAVSGTRYYAHNGTTVAVRTPAKLSWVFGDHHGTADASIDADTLAVTYRRHLPFGETRGVTPATWPGERGFVGGTIDGTGLIHLGAREYDASIGRFVSVDPVVDYTDPGQLHGYAYANNSPLTYSDPDGLAPSKCSWWDLICKAKEKAAELAAKARKAWEAAQAIARAIAERARQLAAAAWEAAKKVAKKVVEVVKKVVQKVKQVVKKVVQTVKKAVKRVVDRVKQVVKRVAKKVKQAVKKTVEKIRKKLGIPKGTVKQHILPKEVFAEGGSPKGPAPRPKVKPGDYQLHHGKVVEQAPPNPFGKSSYKSIEHLQQNVGGHVWKLSTTTRLPDGLAMVRDGKEVGGRQPEGHVSIYPTKSMELSEFERLINKLPWEYVGRVKKVPPKEQEGD